MGMATLNPCVLAINSGSSSLKASLFKPDGTREDFRYNVQSRHNHDSLDQAFKQLFAALSGIKPDVIAHRFVHGGDMPDAFRVLNDNELQRLESIIVLAPLHLPVNLAGVRLCAKQFDTAQIACFDTAFHHTLPDIAKRLPIPSSEKIHRYGFHGLSYAYLISKLPALIGDKAKGNVVLAHLGSGASLCLTKNLQSVDTTMGYTPCGGIPMATRSGDLDPGVIMALARRYDHETLSDMVDHHMGLIALSEGESSNMAELMHSDSLQARFAVDYFCHQVTATIGSLAAKAGGLDALVFSGGIGEHAPLIRAKICAPLAFMNVTLEADLNQQAKQIISTNASIPVLCIATDEEFMLQQYARAFLVSHST